MYMSWLSCCCAIGYGAHCLVCCEYCCYVGYVVVVAISVGFLFVCYSYMFCFVCVVTSFLLVLSCCYVFILFIVIGL